MADEYDEEFAECYKLCFVRADESDAAEADYAMEEEERINDALRAWKERKANNDAGTNSIAAADAAMEEEMPRKKKVSSPDTSPSEKKEEPVYKATTSPPADQTAVAFSGRSVKELYFFDLQHTRELYKNFDVKLQVLYVLTKSPYGIAINQLRRHIGLRGNNDHVREKIKDALCFWNGVGLAAVVYDGAFGTMPSPMLWECTDVEKAKELLSAIALTHTALKTEALRNGGIEKLYLANRNTTYCIGVGKKTRRTM